MRHLAGNVSPALALSLAGLWLLLNQTFTFADVILGLGLGVAIAAFASALRPMRARLRRLDTALLLLVVVLREILISNYSVARVVFLTSCGRAIRSGFLRVPLDLRDPHGLAALAAIVTATPGTVWAGLSPSGDSLTLHVLDLGDEAELIGLIKNRYEKPLMRIFE